MGTPPKGSRALKLIKYSERKKMMKKIIGILLILALALSLAACGGKEQTDAEDDKYVIGFTSIMLNHSYCGKLAKAIEDAAAQHEDVELVVLDGNNDPTTQIETIDTLYSMDVDLIIVQPFPGVESSLVKFNERGTPIVFVNIVPTITDEFTLDYTYVGSREAQAGELQADYIAEVLPENGRICYLISTLGFDSAVQRREGFMSVIDEKRPDAQIIDEQTGNDDTAASMTVVEDWVQRFGSDGIDCIISQSNNMTLGVVEALKTTGLNGKIIVGGIDCLSPYGPDNLLAGDVMVEIYQDPFAQGKAALETAYKILKGEPVEQWVWVDFVTVTKENAADFYED